jgi:hypothetical protein
MKYFYNASIIIGIILLGMIALTPQVSAPIKLGNSETQTNLINPTDGTVNLTTNTSTLVLNANSGRLYASICSVPTNTTSTFLTISNKTNASGTVIGVQATANNGIYLAVGSCYSINSSNLLSGMVNAYANASNTLSTLYQ